MVQNLLLCNSSFKFTCGNAHRLVMWRSGDQSVINGCVVEIRFISQVYLGSHLRNFPETAHHVPLCHLIQPIYVWLRSVINAGHFT